MTGTTIAGIAGLTIGVVVIVAFSLIFSTPNNHIIGSVKNVTLWEPTYHLNLSITGMRDSYHVGEPITFTIGVSGYGYYCQTPNSWIWNASSPDHNGIVWFSGLPEVLCLEQTRSPNQNYTSIDDKFPYGLDRNITITKPGHNVLNSRIAGDPPVQKQFTVTH